MNRVVFLAFFLTPIYQIIAINLQVKVKNGVIEGLEDYDRNGNVFYSYRGIPFAKPPIRSLKFMPPEDADPWSGIYKAHDYAPMCPQERKYSFPQSEDCLYLNVFVSNPNDSSPKAVMFYIHGGGFSGGISNSYYLGPEYLMAQNIILITMSYRLGLLGFAQFDDPTLAVFGNNGLKDQVQALRWVNENIRAFGGDPETITMVGNSAGAECVHLHLLSPMSKGLFKRAIMESAYTIYLSRGWKSSREMAEVVNQKLHNGNFSVRSDWDALQVINASDPWDMRDVLATIKTKGYSLTIPVVESPLSPQPFLTKHPMQLMSEGLFNDVPVIYGYTDCEALSLCSDDFSRSAANFYNVDSRDKLFFLFGRTFSNVTEFIDHYKRVLVPTFVQTSQPTVYDYCDIINAMMVLVPLRDTVQMQWTHAKSPTYLYRFQMDTGVNFMKRRPNSPFAHMKGAGHADELGYLFRPFFAPEVVPNSIEDRGIDTMTTLWTNFVKTGNPNLPNPLNVTWLPLLANNGFNSLNIDVNLTQRTGGFAEQEMLDHWMEFRKTTPLVTIKEFGGFFQKLFDLNEL